MAGPLMLDSGLCRMWHVRDVSRAVTIHTASQTVTASAAIAMGAEGPDTRALAANRTRTSSPTAVIASTPLWGEVAVRMTREYC